MIGTAFAILTMFYLGVPSAAKTAFSFFVPYQWGKSPQTAQNELNFKNSDNLVGQLTTRRPSYFITLIMVQYLNVVCGFMYSLQC